MKTFFDALGLHFLKTASRLPLPVLAAMLRESGVDLPSVPVFAPVPPPLPEVEPLPVLEVTPDKKEAPPEPPRKQESEERDPSSKAS